MSSPLPNSSAKPRKLLAIASKVAELFPIVAALYPKWLDLSSVGSQAANELVNVILSMRYEQNSVPSPAFARQIKSDFVLSFPANYKILNDGEP